MRELIVTPGRICGEISAQGSKNSVLPILSAALLTDEPVILKGCPRLADVECAISILTHLGRTVSHKRDTLIISGSVTASDIPECLMRRMRSSVTFLGALLARTGSATLTYPGGCELGPRPIDIHLDALSRLGVEIQDDGTVLSCTAASRLIGTRICLRFPSVGATENILMAAALAKGDTVLENAAREPEIVDLARFLRSLGLDIHGEGSSVISIRGCDRLHGSSYRIASDRIATGTYLCAAAVTGGKICISGVETPQLSTLCEILARAGCEIDAEADRIRLEAPERLNAVSRIVTEPYPGFPTDLQAPLMAALTLANGETVFDERIFRNRFRHVPELVQMGADITVRGTCARVIGVPTLHGRSVCAHELRGGAALVVAALAADSPSAIAGLAYIERGYENIDGVLRSLGISAYLNENPNSISHLSDSVSDT